LRPVVDMGTSLVCRGTIGVRREPHRGHAEGCGGLEVARNVVDHGGCGGRDRMALDQRAIAADLGLRQEAGGRDVEHRLETVAHAEPVHHPLGMARRAVGEHERAPREPAEGGFERRGGLEQAVVDAVDIVEELVRICASLRHQPAKRGAVVAEIALLQRPRRERIERKPLGDELADAAVDLGEQIRGRRVERVVEVEHPDQHMR
jgi:hypothetical protein